MLALNFKQFLRDESGAITVDWVVLTAAAAGMALGATAIVEEGINDLASDLEAELRTQQVSDAFVVYTPTHFDPLFDAGTLTEEEAEAYFDDANLMTNAELLTALEEGILALNEGTLTDAELAELTAMASVAIQRNIISADDIDLTATS